MKSTGIVRKVDELGRVVLPKGLRQSLDIHENDTLEIFVDDGRIVLQKYQPACVFCGNADQVVYYHDKRVCHVCLAELKAL